MSVVYNCLLSPKLTNLPAIERAKNASFMNSPLFNTNIQQACKKVDLLSPAVASITGPLLDVDYLQREFSSNGVSFTKLSDSCVVRMALENGSVIKIMLPSGLVTSYKAPMWHGGLVELLHTIVSEGEKGADPIIQGGMALDLKYQNDEGDSSSPCSWSLNGVKGNSQDMIQVELISRDSEGSLEVRNTITLKEDHLNSKIRITNSGASTIRLEGSLISHLVVSTPEATYALGLDGSDFFNKSPVQTNFSIIPPGFNEKVQDSKKFWDPAVLLAPWSSKDSKKASNSSSLDDTEEILEGEEEDSYKQLTEKMSKIYINAPRDFTIIDRGRRNSVVIAGDGFKELYLFSPGSKHNSYGKYSYISIGHTALLEPIVLKSQGKWRGGQQICNPNL